MTCSAIVLILAQAFSVDFTVMGETQADVLQCLPVWFLLTGASMFLWAEIYHGNFDPFIKSVENLVKATASLCTSLAILATCAIADHWVAISEIIIDVVKLAVTISAIVWTILLIIFFWQNRKEL